MNEYKISSQLRKSLISYLASRPIGEALNLFNQLVAETQEQTAAPIKPVEKKDEAVSS